MCAICISWGGGGQDSLSAALHLPVPLRLRGCDAIDRSASEMCAII